MQTDALFPFVAFVGQEMLKRGLRNNPRKS